MAMHHKVETTPVYFTKERTGVIENHETLLDPTSEFGVNVGDGRRMMMNHRDFIMEPKRGIGRGLVEAAIQVLKILRLDTPSGHHLRERIRVEADQRDPQILQRQELQRVPKAFAPGPKSMKAQSHISNEAPKYSVLYSAEPEINLERHSSQSTQSKVAPELKIVIS